VKQFEESILHAMTLLLPGALRIRPGGFWAYAVGAASNTRLASRAKEINRADSRALVMASLLKESKFDARDVA
jgi:hypothetical protein